MGSGSKPSQETPTGRFRWVIRGGKPAAALDAATGGRQRILQQEFEARRQSVWRDVPIVVVP